MLYLIDSYYVELLASAIPFKDEGQTYLKTQAVPRSKHFSSRL